MENDFSCDITIKDVRIEVKLEKVENNHWFVIVNDSEDLDTDKDISSSN